MSQSLPNSSEFDVNAPIESARVPPAVWYADERYHQLDAQRVLIPNWQVVAHRQQLLEPGAYQAGCTASQPWVVVRDQQGELRAFANVCRHNGTPVAQGEGQLDQFVCSYHGWTYDLAGRLTKAPRMAGITDFERSDFGLVPLPLKIFGPLILVNLSGSSATWEVTEAEYELDQRQWNNLHLRKQRSYELACNWKVFVDNYLDGGYHVPSLHQDLASGLDMDSYRTDVFSSSVLQTVNSLSSASERVAGAALYAWIYPNLMINRYGPMMDINRVTPLGAGRCRVDFDWYFEASCSEDFIEKSLRSSDQVQQEDITVCEALQQGMASRHYRPGPYAPRVEMAKHHFHRMLAADYGRSI